MVPNCRTTLIRQLQWLTVKIIYIYIKKGLFWVHVLLKTSNLTGRFHVVVVQQRLRNVQKSVMHLQSCCFAYLNLLIFCRSRWLRRRNCLSSSFIEAGVIIRLDTFAYNESLKDLTSLPHHQHVAHKNSFSRPLMAFRCGQNYTDGKNMLKT